MRVASLPSFLLAQPAARALALALLVAVVLFTVLAASGAIAAGRAEPNPISEHTMPFRWLGDPMA
jgi:hypothetical protein